MKKVVITGATGMVGGIVLRECLNSNEVSEVVSFVRRPSGVQHDKLTEVIHKDFLDYTGVEEHFEGVHAACFCIGVYTGAVPDAKFKEITVDYTNRFADALKANSPSATFCLLSGAGADQTEKSRMSFAKYKGMSENYLIKQDFGQLYLFRPGYIYPVEPRKEPNLSYRIFRGLYPLVKRIFPATAITSEQLGQAIFKASLHGAEKMILENEDIKAVL